MERSLQSDPAIGLLADPFEQDGADITFRRVLDLIRSTRTTLEIHMFVWRNDAIGREIGQAVLDAASRGVKVMIRKDCGARLFECVEMNRKPFLNVPVGQLTTLHFKSVGLTFPDTLVHDEFDDALGNAVMSHPNVTLCWVQHTHTKYYVFDERILITGSINIEDRHRLYRDYMVEIRGADLVRRFRQRLAGQVPYSADTHLDFAVNRNEGDEPRFEIKPLMIDALSRARTSVYIEMAYLGDPDLSAAIIKAAAAGVEVRVLFSKAANIGNDINYKTMYQICRSAPVDVTFSDRMIHSKLIIVDDTIAILGSANLSVFSMQMAAELDVIIRDNPTFMAALRAVAEQRLRSGVALGSTTELARYNHILAAGQQLHQKLARLLS